MKDNQEYIAIRSIDLRRDFPYRANESLMRSLENYLEKNKQSYSLVDGDYLVDVNSKNDALRLGQYFNTRFGVSKISYFNGEALSALPVIGTEGKRRALRATVVDIASGEKVSLRKYRKDTQKEIDQKYISFRDISGRKIISPAKLKKLVGDGSLKAVDIGSNRYVDKAGLLMFLKKKAE